jgi:RNA polymerase sigma factor (TIGR02999 family)
MKIYSSGDVTQLLIDWRNGDQEALNKLMPLVYNELRRIARHKLQQYGLGGQLQPTALVHEAYIKLVDQSQVEWRNRAHFYAIAAKTIRRILVDDYRRRTANKRGGNADIILLSESDTVANAQSIDLLALNEALERLSTLSARQARIIEMKFFGGLNNEEVAEALDISLATLEREWRAAKAWLRSLLT